MRLWIIAVGHKMPPWIEEGFGEYCKRMPRETRIELLVIKPEKHTGGRTTEQILRAEESRIAAAIPPHGELIVLDERGSSYNTRQLSDLLAGWMREGKDVVFVIGGADGLHDSIKNRAKGVWSLSELTLPHGLVRIILAEQLYRASTIRQNHPYHRE